MSSPASLPQTINMDSGIKDFLESSTIHGLSHISTTRRLIRLFWMFVVLTGFTVAAVMIQQSFSSWADSPISTTLETRPITEIDFPNVTVCPPRNSFTSLIPDLVRSRNITFAEEERQELSDGVVLAVYNSSYNVKYQEFLDYRQGRYMDWYTGISGLGLPEISTWNGREKIYNLETSSITGSFSTPHFREPLSDHEFEFQLTIKYRIHVPANMIFNNFSKIIIDIDMDISVDIAELISIGVSTFLYDDFSIFQKEKEWITKNQREFQRKYRIGDFSVYDNM